MTVDEEVLSRWLHGETPEPPHTLTVADIRPADTTSIRRLTAPSRWAPLLAAAVVVAIVATVTVLSTRTTHHREPPVHNPPPISSSPTVTTTAHAIGPWGASEVPRSTENMLFLTAANNSIYVENAGPVERIDPSTGRVLATTQDVGNVNAVTVADGALWSPVGLSVTQFGEFELDALDLTSLTPVASIKVTFSAADPAADALVASSADGTRVAVAFNTDIAIIDTAQHRIIHQFAIEQAVGAMALNADGSRLYLGEQEPDLPPAPQHDNGGLLHTVDPLTGADLAPAVAVPHSFETLTATPGGVWVTTHGIEGDGPSLAGRALYWVPTGATHLGRAVAATRSAVTYQDGVVWIATSGETLCADPATGHMRASTKLASSGAFLGPFYAAGGQLYGAYDPSANAPRGYIVHVTPPKACTP